MLGLRSNLEKMQTIPQKLKYEDYEKLIYSFRSKKVLRGRELQCGRMYTWQDKLLTLSWSALWRLFTIKILPIGKPVHVYSPCGTAQNDDEPLLIAQSPQSKTVTIQC